MIVNVDNFFIDLLHKEGSDERVLHSFVRAKLTKNIKKSLNLLFLLKIQQIAESSCKFIKNRLLLILLFFELFETVIYIFKEDFFLIAAWLSVIFFFEQICISLL